MRDKSNGRSPGPTSPTPREAALSAPPAVAASAVPRRRGWLLAAVLAMAAFAAMPLDCPLAQWCLARNCPRVVREILYLIEPFGNGMGVCVIALVIHQLDIARRRALPRVLACSLGAGLAADVVKLTLARTRPSFFSFEGGVWATFGEWFPLTSAGTAGQSFPSAHTATAVGLAAALVWLYPAGRRLFPAMAVLVACQRIEAGIHYLSDTLFGAALGCLVATAVLNSGRLAGWFDRWERGGAIRRQGSLRSDIHGGAQDPPHGHSSAGPQRSQPFAA